MYRIYRLILRLIKIIRPGISYTLGYKFEKSNPRINKMVRIINKGIIFDLDLNRYIDLVIYYTGYFEGALVDKVKKIIRNGDVVIDVGGNSGYYTSIFASLTSESGKVYVFEPTFWGVLKIINQIKINNFKNVEIFKSALSDKYKNKTDIITFDPYYSIYNDEYNGKFFSSEQIQFESLDHLFYEKNIRVDHIKIDVDGPEMDILKGGDKLINKYLPSIFIEFGYYTYKKFGYSWKDFFDFFIDRGYLLFSENKFEPIKTIVDIDKYIVSKAENTTNIICIHNSKINNLIRL